MKIFLEDSPIRFLFLFLVFISQTSIYAETIAAPEHPKGPANAIVMQRIKFTTEIDTYSRHHKLEYQFSWGDGKDSDWLIKPMQSHIYETLGEMKVRVRTRCVFHPHITSAWSIDAPIIIEIKEITIGPSGPSVALLDETVEFTSHQITSHFNHPLEYQFSWENGIESNWSSNQSQQYIYSSLGEKQIKSRARCIIHKEIGSLWSTSQTIYITKRHPKLIRHDWVNIKMFVDDIKNDVSFNISNSIPDSMLVYSLSISDPWISTSIRQGKLAGHQSEEIFLTIDTTDFQSNSTYEGNITLKGNNNIRSDITIKVEIIDPASPTVIRSGNNQEFTEDINTWELTTDPVQTNAPIYIHKTKNGNILEPLQLGFTTEKGAFFSNHTYSDIDIGTYTNVYFTVGGFDSQYPKSNSFEYEVLKNNKNLDLDLPNLILPLEITTINASSMRFQWQAVNNATYYDIEILLDDDSNTVVLKEITSDLVFDIPSSLLKNNQNYKWRIRANSENSTSLWQNYTFTTDLFYKGPNGEKILFSFADQPINLSFPGHFDIDSDNIKADVYQINSKVPDKNAMDWTNVSVFSWNKIDQITAIDHTLAIDQINQGDLYKISPFIEENGHYIQLDDVYIYQSAFSKNDFITQKVFNPMYIFQSDTWGGGSSEDLIGFSGDFEEYYPDCDSMFYDSEAFRTTLDKANKALRFNNVVIEIPAGLWIMEKLYTTFNQIHPTYKLEIRGAGKTKSILINSIGTFTEENMVYDRRFGMFWFEKNMNVNIHDFAIWGVDPVNPINNQIINVHGKLQPLLDTDEKYYRYSRQLVAIRVGAQQHVWTEEYIEYRNKVLVEHMDLRYLSNGIRIRETKNLPENEQKNDPNPWTLEANDVDISYTNQAIGLEHAKDVYIHDSQIYRASTQGFISRSDLDENQQNCSNIVLKNVTIEGARHRGINIQKTDNVWIQDCKIFQSGMSGIHFGGGTSYAWISDNIIDRVDRDNSIVDSEFDVDYFDKDTTLLFYRSVANGIKIKGGLNYHNDHIVIINNTVKHAGDGIAVFNGTTSNAVIENNNISAIRRGIRLDYGSFYNDTNDQIHQGILSNIYIAKQDKIILDGSSNYFSCESRYNMLFPQISDLDLLVDPNDINDTVFLNGTKNDDCNRWSSEEWYINFLPSYGQDINTHISVYPHPILFNTSGTGVENPLTFTVYNLNDKTNGSIYIDDYYISNQDLVNNNYIQSMENGFVTYQNNSEMLTQMDKIKMEIRSVMTKLINAAGIQ